MSGSFTYCVPHRCFPCFILSAKLPESAMLRTFRMVAGVLMRISYASRPRCPALRTGQREFSVFVLFCCHSSFLGIGVHSIHRLNFPYSKVTPRCGRAWTSFDFQRQARSSRTAGFFKKISTPQRSLREPYLPGRIFLNNPASKCGAAQDFEYGKFRRWVLRTGC